jgi:hypothetical protein
MAIDYSGFALPKTNVSAKMSKAAKKRHKEFLIQKGYRCAACGKGFRDADDVELAHLESCGAGGGKRQDVPGNLVLMHARANREQGSMSFTEYMNTKWKPEHCQ